MNRSIIKEKSNQITVSKKTWSFSTLSRFVIFLPFLLPHLQDLLAVLNALLLPGVEDPLHWRTAHPVIQAGEDPKADGTGHRRRNRTSPTLIERLEGERDLSALRHFHKMLVKAQTGQSWRQGADVFLQFTLRGGEVTQPLRSPSPRGAKNAKPVNNHRSCQRWDGSLLNTGFPFRLTLRGTIRGLPARNWRSFLKPNFSFLMVKSFLIFLCFFLPRIFPQTADDVMKKQSHGLAFYLQRHRFPFVPYLHGEMPFQLSIWSRCGWREGFPMSEQAVEKIFYTHGPVRIKIMEDFLKHLEKGNHVF